ncbi:hypothetical protein AB2C32_00570 [Pseudomonas aeruginosa]
MSSTQHQLIEQCATRLRGIVEALDNIHDTSPHRWSTDLDDVHSSAESLLALIKDQAPPSEDQLIAAGLSYPLAKEDAVKLWYSGFRSEVITVLEAWEAIGHDTGINPDKEELLESLRNMAAICNAHGNDMPAQSAIDQRQVIADAITGALAFGAQASQPPAADHWLRPFYDIGRAEGQRTQELAMLVRMLASSLKRHAPESNLVARATNYLAAKGLAGTPLRDSPALVEQAGGDEREEFEAWMHTFDLPPQLDGETFADERYLEAACFGQFVYDDPLTQRCWAAWQARAALAQPSPKCAACNGSGFVEFERGAVIKDCPRCHRVAQPSPAPELDFSRPLETENGEPVKWICADVIEYKSARVCVAKDTGLVYSSPYIGLKIRNVMPEQAEAERPEMSSERAAYFMRRFKAEEKMLGPNEQAAVDYVLSLIAQHERIVKAWIERWKAYIELSAKIAAQRDAANARLHEVATACATAEQERDAAMARCAELEHVLRVVVNAADHGSWPTTVMHGIEKVREVLAGSAPPVKAQPEETPGEILAAKLIETWVAKHGKPAPWSKIVEITALATSMPNDERDRLLALDDDVDAQAQHSVPEGWKPVPIEPLLNMMSDKDHDTRITAERQLLSILAAAPGNSVPQAWLDVQAERRRQITAEGWTPEHDDLYCAAELPRAAAAYILNGANDEAPAIWPFSAKWWKPRDARANYVRAAALILAEIERLDRAGISQSPQPGATTASS